MKTIPKSEYWVTNISPRNVTLADLALNIKAFTTVNLLDNKHYKYTLEQLEKSAASGSIYAKRDKIKPRLLPPPTVIKEPIQIQKEAVIPSRERSIFTIKEENYDELQLSDDDFIKEITADPEAETNKTTKKG